jgi:hypothetical protein
LVQNFVRALETDNGGPTEGWLLLDGRYVHGDNMKVERMPDRVLRTERGDSFDFDLPTLILLENRRSHTTCPNAP